jgi:hypothetical protein
MFHVKQLLFFLLLTPVAISAQVMGTSTIEVKAFPPLPKRDAAIELFLSQFGETAQLSQQKKEWFYWTNYSRSNPRRFYDSIVEPILISFPNLRNSYSISLKRDLYNSKPLPLIKPNNSLDRIAQEFATEMASKKASPSHTSPSGKTFQNRMESAKIKKCAGENISWGPDNPVLMLVLLYIDEGVPDMGHRKTLLDPSFVEMGIGVGQYPDKKLMIIQDFACDQQ